MKETSTEAKKMPVKILKVFDFDQTLFNSPAHTDANLKLYEKHSGLPWNISKEEAMKLSKRLGRPIHPRRGWWGRAESLQPPLVPDPTPNELWIQPTVDAFLKDLDRDDVFTILMTGRHAGLQQEVFRILHQGPLNVVSKIEGKQPYQWSAANSACYLLGQNGPCPEIVGAKPNETFPWKVWIIQQYRLVYPNLEQIIIWEDRDEHVRHFRELNHEFQETVIVHHVR